MKSAKHESEELSASEKAMLAAFVVPAPSGSMEEALLAALRTQRRPGDHALQRVPTRAVLVVTVFAAAAALLWILHFDQSSPRDNHRSVATKQNHEIASVIRPGATRPGESWALAGSAPGSYETGIDSTVLRNETATRFLRALEVNSGYGSLTQKVDGQDYQGKRLRLSALVRSDSVAAWAGLWMQVEANKEHIAFDNMKSRPIVGTTDWSLYSVVLDVPENATEISYGVLLSGLGTVWIDDLMLEPVPDTVASTNAMDATGWFEGDSWMDYFETGIDPKVVRGGKAVRFLGSKGSAVGQQGTWITRVDASTYRDRRVRFSAYVRTDALTSWAGLWIRADVKDATSQKVLSSTLVNMVKHPIRGTTGWARYEVVLDVDGTATQLVYGVMLDGDGKLWMDEPILEILAE